MALQDQRQVEALADLVAGEHPRRRALCEDPARTQQHRVGGAGRGELEDPFAG
ncbi:hypothetical protein ACIRP7_25235 [Streptomyces sp. NPDC102270]|uniref:hypothetical protein n=1 Tax=Streptomyces sp. NPDC102270 TaxID=3366150 RepID=UPI0037F9C542